MIASFADGATEDVFDGRDSRRARASCPPTLWRVAWRKLDQINRATDLRDLAVPPGNRFTWKEGYAYDGEITDDH